MTETSSYPWITAWRPHKRSSGTQSRRPQRHHVVASHSSEFLGGVVAHVAPPRPAMDRSPRFSLSPATSDRRGLPVATCVSQLPAQRVHDIIPHPSLWALILSQPLGGNTGQDVRMAPGGWHPRGRFQPVGLLSGTAGLVVNILVLRGNRKSPSPRPGRVGGLQRRGLLTRNRHC